MNRDNNQVNNKRVYIIIVKGNIAILPDNLEKENLIVY
jgi:hypothetical protein